MKEIKYNTRMFIEENGQVIIRVRWNQKKNEVAFSVGCYADPKKWDCGNQRARDCKINCVRYNKNNNYL